jgi:hypothetical protein
LAALVVGVRWSPRDKDAGAPIVRNIGSTEDAMPHGLRLTTPATVVTSSRAQRCWNCDVVRSL